MKLLDNIMTLNIESHMDIISSELQCALIYLSEITGEIYTEDVIANIFNKFCVGK